MEVLSKYDDPGSQLSNFIGFLNIQGLRVKGPAGALVFFRQQLTYLHRNPFLIAEAQTKAHMRAENNRLDFNERKLSDPLPLSMALAFV